MKHPTDLCVKNLNPAGGRILGGSGNYRRQGLLGRRQSLGKVLYLYWLLECESLCSTSSSQWPGTAETMSSQALLSGMSVK